MENDKTARNQDHRGRPTEAILQDIPGTLEGIDSRLEGVDQRFDRMEERWMAVTDKLEVLTDKHSELKEENERLNKKVSHLEDKVTYLEGQSKRNNPVFHGFQEKRRGTWDEYEEAVSKVIEENLDPDAWDESVLPIERAHRTEKFEKGKTRPIVVEFSDYK